MPHRNSRPTTGRRERGAVAVELAMLLPLLLAMVLFSVQVGMWFYARSIALSAAEEGARTSAARTSSLDAGLTTARQFAAAAALAALVTLLSLVYFYNLGGWGLIEPDEGRYSEIPREMIASGDWVTPRLNGVKYFEKPVMYYWMVASSLKAFGPSELSARIPCAASALLGAASRAFRKRRM